MKFLISFLVFTSIFGSNARAFSSDFIKDPVQEAIENSSIVYRFINKDQLQQISREVSRNSKVIKGRQLIIDTRDQEQCLEIQRQLNQSGARPNSYSESDLCEPNAKNPFVSLTVFAEVDQTEFQKDIDLSFIKSDERNAFNETRNLTIGALGMAGILYMMPESVTKWDKTKNSRSLIGKYKDNVRNGPVRDHDDWIINYVGHPLSGAAYYQVARNLNMSRFESFGYSVMMSTFFWEYGIEAFAEVPSIQDLWITPVVGSLIGEVFFQMEQNIKANGGTVFGSKKLGNLVMILLNPAGALSNKINQLLGAKVVQSSRMYVGPVAYNCHPSDPANCRKYGVALRLEMIF